MPTIVGILTFISMINTPSKSLKIRNIFIFFQYFSFYEQLKFHAQLSCAWKSFVTLGSGFWMWLILNVPDKVENAEHFLLVCDQYYMEYSNALKSI